jgi:uncharacterized protein YjiS (DUF1127 family)
MAMIPESLRGQITMIRDKVGALGVSMAFRFRRWREDQQTWSALRHLDDHQLKEFGIYARPPDLTKRKFP